MDPVFQGTAGVQLDVAVRAETGRGARPRSNQSTHTLVIKLLYHFMITVIRKYGAYEPRT